MTTEMFPVMVVMGKDHCHWRRGINRYKFVLYCVWLTFYSIQNVSVTICLLFKFLQMLATHTCTYPNQYWESDENFCSFPNKWCFEVIGLRYVLLTRWDSQSHAGDTFFGSRKLNKILLKLDLHFAPWRCPKHQKDKQAIHTEDQEQGAHLTMWMWLPCVKVVKAKWGQRRIPATSCLGVLVILASGLAQYPLIFFARTQNCVTSCTPPYVITDVSQDCRRHFEAQYHPHAPLKKKIRHVFQKNRPAEKYFDCFVVNVSSGNCLWFMASQTLGYAQ